MAGDRVIYGERQTLSVVVAETILIVFQKPCLFRVFLFLGFLFDIRCCVCSFVGCAILIADFCMVLEFNSCALLLSLKDRFHVFLLCANPWDARVSAEQKGEVASTSVIRQSRQGALRRLSEINGSCIQDLDQKILLTNRELDSVVAGFRY